MAKSHLQGHQKALLNFGPSTYVSYNSWRSNLTYLFYAWGSKVIFFSSINQTINQLYLNTVNGSASCFSDMPWDNYNL